MFRPTVTLFVLVSCLSIWAGGIAAAEFTTKDRHPQIVQPQSHQNTKTLTGKERLGKKWTDEQRLDNCKVPIDKRGDKPRPDACKSDQTMS